MTKIWTGHEMWKDGQTEGRNSYTCQNLRQNVNKFKLQIVLSIALFATTVKYYVIYSVLANQIELR